MKIYFKSVSNTSRTLDTVLLKKYFLDTT